MSSSRGWWDFCSTAAHIGMKEPKGIMFVLATLVNCSVEESKRSMKSALLGPLCQCQILTVKQRHVEDQPAPTFRNSRSTIQESRNPFFISEMTAENTYGSIFHSLHFASDGFPLPFFNTVDRIHIGCWFFGFRIWPVSQFILKVDILPFHLQKDWRCLRGYNVIAK